MSTVPGLAVPSPSAVRPARRIGGWLVVAIINLIITCCTSIFMFIFIAVFLLPPAPPAADGAAPHATLWTALAVFDLVARASLFFACIVLLVLLFKKRRLAPRFAIWFWAVSLGATIIGLIWAVKVGAPGFRAVGLPDEADSAVVMHALAVARTGSMALVWIPYFLWSDRVRDTFITVPPWREAMAQPLHQPTTPLEVAVATPDSPYLDRDVPWWKVPRWYHWLGFVVVACLIGVAIATDGSITGRLVSRFIIWLVAAIVIFDMQRQRGSRRRALTGLEPTPPAPGTPGPAMAAQPPLAPSAASPAPDLYDLDESEGFTRGSGYVAQRFLKATPAQIRRAADAWADHSGWRRLRDEAGASVYRRGSFAWNTLMKVTVSPNGDVAETRFQIGMRDKTKGNGIFIPVRKEYMLAAKHFAEGVCNELAFETRAFPLPDYERWARRRDRLKRLIRTCSAAYWVLLGAAVPAGVAVGLATWNAMMGIAVWFWLVGLWLVDASTLMRSIGMKVVWMTVSAVLWCLIALGLTLGALLG